MLKKLIETIFLVGVFLHPIEAARTASKCEKSVTTVHGTKIPSEKLCSGDLIFEETFETLDLDIWEHVNELTDNGVRKE
jgi:hypothetical protein